ncbi:MAG: hypothetical protein U0625_06830 [Phycisphaerales bacterium]
MRTLAIASRLCLIAAWVGALLVTGELACDAILRNFGTPSTSAWVWALGARWGAILTALAVLTALLCPLVSITLDRMRLSRTEEMARARACNRCGYADAGTGERCSECGAAPVQHVAPPLSAVLAYTGGGFFGLGAGRGANAQLGDSVGNALHAAASAQWIQRIDRALFTLIVVNIVLTQRPLGVPMSMSLVLLPFVAAAILLRITIRHCMSFRAL